MAMLSDWSQLSEELQLTLSREALRQAVLTVAGQADTLALEIEDGHLADRGGPDALRLFATVLRVMHGQESGAMGHA